jgi:hypothetical protein
VSWVKLDDSFHRNDKQLQMSDGAFRVYVCAMSWCAQATEPTGYLTTAQARALVASLGKKPAVIAELVKLNAWEEAEGGYLIHDYEEYLEKGSVERVRRFRERKRTGNVTGNGSVTSEPVTKSVTETAPVTDEGVTVTALARDGYPVPKPVPGPVPGPTGLRPSGPSPHSVRGVTSAAPKSSSAEPGPEPKSDPWEQPAEGLCELMQALVSERAKPPTITAAWRHDARLLLSRDKRPLAEAEALMRWAASHSFWRRNVMGLPKFREQYDRLLMEMQEQPPTNGRADSRVDTPATIAARRLEALSAEWEGQLQ